MNTAYLPKQHGAWAMLAVPFVLGMAIAGPVWLHIPLFLFWLSAYLLSYPFLQWIKKKDLARYGKPMLLYGVLTGFSGVAVLIGKPSLAAWAPLFVPLFLVNMHFAGKNRERAFLNDLAAVVQFNLMIFVAAAAGKHADWQSVWIGFLLGVLYFVGTIFYVKTMIREKHNPLYWRLSVGYHAVLPVLALAVFRSWLVGLMFVVLLVRAVAVPRVGLRVAIAGMLEFAMAILLTVSVLAAVS